MPFFQKREHPDRLKEKRMTTSALRSASVDATKHLDLELNREATLTHPNLWMNEYDNFPVREYAEVSGDFGDLIQHLQLTQIAQDRMPVELRNGLSPGLKLGDERYYNERYYQELILWDALKEIAAGYHRWESFSAIRMSERDETFYLFFVALQMQSLFYLRFLLEDFRRTVFLWLGHLDMSEHHRLLEAKWLEMREAPTRTVKDIVTNWGGVSSGDAERMGFTADMWDFVMAPSPAGSKVSC